MKNFQKILHFFIEKFGGNVQILYLCTRIITILVTLFLVHIMITLN